MLRLKSKKHNAEYEGNYVRTKASRKTQNEERKEGIKCTLVLYGEHLWETTVWCLFIEDMSIYLNKCQPQYEHTIHNYLIASRTHDYHTQILCLIWQSENQYSK